MKLFKLRTQYKVTISEILGNKIEGSMKIESMTLFLGGCKSSTIGLLAFTIAPVSQELRQV